MIHLVPLVKIMMNTLITFNIYYLQAVIHLVPLVKIMMNTLITFNIYYLQAVIQKINNLTKNFRVIIKINKNMKHLLNHKNV
jgi:hypothetical protein